MVSLEDGIERMEARIETMDLIETVLFFVRLTAPE